ncbi:hypothetical protein B0H14DRAFT_2590674 [Mycena olivaceomarginata]|nr:hypothetical protein B0H14DRAFT_2590674 [Mycena olivaceomarginata]
MRALPSLDKEVSNVEWDRGSEKWIRSSLLRDQIDKDMASKTKIEAKTRFDARRWDGPGGIWLLSVATLPSPEGTGVRTQAHESNRVRAVGIWEALGLPVYVRMRGLTENNARGVPEIASRKLQKRTVVLWRTSSSLDIAAFAEE